MRVVGYQAQADAISDDLPHPIFVACPRLEDSEERIAWFRERIPYATFARCADDALKALSANSYRAIFLDHDLHWLHKTDNGIVKGTGKEIAIALAKRNFGGIVVIHSKNEAGARLMAKYLPQAKLVRFGDFEIASLS